jgi:Tfp pilus assembly protein PilF
LAQFWRYTRKSCAQAQHHFSQAVAYDWNYAAAHAWLARTFAFQFYMNWVPNSQSALVLALNHARRAVELDSQSSLAHAILALALTHLKEGESALMEGRRSCALDPSSADAKLFLSFILAVTGRRDEALRNIETAMLLQPYPSSLFFEVLGVCHFALGDYGRAITAFSRGIEIKPTFIPCHYQLAVTHGVCGHTDAARSSAAVVVADWPDISLDYFLNPQLEEIWLRGKQVAGLP